MAYREQPVVNQEFFGKKLGRPLIKQELLTDEQKALPRSAIKVLVFWRWKFGGPGAHKIGKLEGDSTMEREEHTCEDIEQKFTALADGRFFQTGYKETPSERMKKCKTVGDIVRVFVPEEIEFNESNPSGPAAVQPPPANSPAPSGQ